MATQDIDAVASQTTQLLDELEHLLSKRENNPGTVTPEAQQSESKKVTQAATPGAKRNQSKNRTANRAALQLLIDAYPEVFSFENVRPLKIGIQEDLIADEKVARNKIKRALATYVRGIAYNRSLVEGADRIGLDGQPAGKVTADEAAHAKAKLKEINKQRREREKEQRKQEKTDRMSNKLEQLVALNKR